MTDLVITHDKPVDLARFVAEKISIWSKDAPPGEDKFRIALSGGQTPQTLFQLMADEYKNKIEWKHVCFYWVDERCVPPDHAESNFGVAKRILIDKVRFPVTNFQRIVGEAEPHQEAERYGYILNANLHKVNFVPSFDLILLGMGDDGHTASLFPDQMHLLDAEDNCVVGIHPVSGQRRVTLTMKVINHAKRILFLITGAEKEDVLRKILNRGEDSLPYPAAYVKPVQGMLEWHVDQNAWRSR